MRPTAMNAWTSRALRRSLQSCGSQAALAMCSLTNSRPERNSGKGETTSVASDSDSEAIHAPIARKAVMTNLKSLLKALAHRQCRCRPCLASGHRPVVSISSIFLLHMGPKRTYVSPLSILILQSNSHFLLHCSIQIAKTCRSW